MVCFTRWVGGFEKEYCSNLLNVYVLEIQMLTDRGELQRLKELCLDCRRIEIQKGAVVSNPTITGIIRECVGKMHMREKKWGRLMRTF